MARANIFTAAARWVRGAVNGRSRMNPRTGVPEIKLGLRGKWFDPLADERPRPTNAAQHPKPPKRFAGVASRAIGSGRIGMGEQIGTGMGTHLESGMASADRAGPGGVIGMRIGGEERGGAGGGSSGGSDKPGRMRS